MLFFSRKKELSAEQAQRKASDATRKYAEIRFAIRNGDKDAKNMVTDYARRYSAWLGNIAQLQAYLKDWS